MFAETLSYGSFFQLDPGNPASPAHPFHLLNPLNPYTPKIPTHDSASDKSVRPESSMLLREKDLAKLSSPPAYGAWGGLVTNYFTNFDELIKQKALLKHSIKIGARNTLLFSVILEVAQQSYLVNQNRKTLGAAFQDGIADVSLGVVSGATGAFLGAKVGLGMGSGGGPIGMLVGLAVGSLLGWGLDVARQELSA